MMLSDFAIHTSLRLQTYYSFVPPTVASIAVIGYNKMARYRRG